MTSKGQSEQLQLSLGLINSSHKYLTSDKFANSVTASGTNLKKKQIWSLEQTSEGSDVYFKSCTGLYLGTDKNGVVICKDATTGDDNAFQVEATLDEGQWAIKSTIHKGYLGMKGDQLVGNIPSITSSSLWTVHLAMHPQVNIYHGRRKAYASVEDDEVRMTKVTPWGVNTLITLDFQQGSYALMLHNHKYLADDGSLQDKVSKNTLYTIEFYAGKIAFKSRNDGKYLTSVGPCGKVQTRKTVAGPDEHFTLIDAHPQISLKSQKKNKFVSGKQGLQLSANQDDVNETEIFQLELKKDSDKVFFRNNNNKYWRLDGNSIKADALCTKTAGTDFEIEWNGRSMRIKVSDGRYIGVVLSGHLQVGSADDFIWQLTNRPVIVFRGEYGFIGQRANKIEGNKAKYDIYQLMCTDGAYIIKRPGDGDAKKNLYWNVNADKKLVLGTEEQTFLIQLGKSSKLAIKPECGGDYITSDHVGILSATETQINSKCSWEY